MKSQSLEHVGQRLAFVAGLTEHDHAAFLIPLQEILHHIDLRMKKIRVETKILNITK